MSYTKTAAVTTAGSEQPALIAFSMDKAKIFDTVSMRSTFMTKSMRGEKGDIIGEEYALSADEKGAFEVILKSVMSVVYETFKKHTDGITSSYQITTSAIIVKVNDHAAYNKNDLDLVDMALEDAIVEGCLNGWFSMRAQGELTKFTSDTFYDRIELLKKRMFSLKMRRAFVTTINAT